MENSKNDEKSKNIKLIANNLIVKGEMNFVEATTEEQILKFEKDFNVKLPEKYKEWLLFSDGGELFMPSGVQLYGIEHKPKIDTNNDDRPK